MDSREAQLWDRRIERGEWLEATAEELPGIIDVGQAFEHLTRVGEEAVKASVDSEFHSADRVLTFADGSRLLLIAFDANTAAGGSRVLDEGEVPSRLTVRDGSPRGGKQHSWLAFPPHDSF